MGEGQGAVLSEQPEKRKLIEVSLPLEAINRESAREKSIRHGHPSTLHLWWARRPLAAARAVLFAQLVDDPSSHPDRFPTEGDLQAERERLHKIIERLVVWENIHDEELYAEAREEILKSTDGEPPPILDPFAGGGTIPLEAQRLGLEAHASDLNPVAVLINKALIEIPPRFAGMPPVFPGLADTEMAGWEGAEGLAADVRAYGEWMRDEAEKRIGKHYPKATMPDGSETTVIAWIWARTVTCPNPACRIQMPLARSWWLSKKKGKEAYVVPSVDVKGDHPNGKQVEFEVHYSVAGGPQGEDDGTVSNNTARCIACGSMVPLKQVREIAGDNGFDQELIAVVGKGHRRRVYLPPSDRHREAAVVAPVDPPKGDLPDKALGFRVQGYGMAEWADLFSDRQIAALTTFSDLVGEARKRAFNDAARAGFLADTYADAIALYLGLSLGKAANLSSNVTTWMSDRGAFRETFARQALSMTWDTAEGNPFSSSGGGWRTILDKVARVVEMLPCGPLPGEAAQGAAEASLEPAAVLSTDPPYYDNIGYADLSDFFYVWLRRTLRDIHPDLFSTVLVPKTEELVANPFRQGGKKGAKEYFESGFREVFARARKSTIADYPITVYYAFKPRDTGEDGESSTGWETLLDGMIHAGWAITATWPVRSEGSGRMRSQRSNALASSIVLALRPRPDDAPTSDRRGLIAALQAELPTALRELQQGAIAPVDLPQAAIGPGMAVFSRYASVIEADGSQMSVRSALARINEILDQVLNEQESDFDATTRFAIAWYRGHGYETGKFGDANSLANARNTSVETMDRAGIVRSAAGKVTLVSPAELPEDYDPVADDSISAWEVLIHMIGALKRSGIEEAARILVAAGSRAEGPVDPEAVKELAFLLFPIAERNGWSQDALAFNKLATGWTEIVESSRGLAGRSEQASLDL